MRIKTLEKQLEQVCFQIESVRSEEQARANTQDQQMQTLAVQLQKEIDARQELLDHLDAQKKHQGV